MKNKISLILLLIVVSIGTQRIFAQSKELEDILGVGKTELEDSKPETKKLYGDLITALDPELLEADPFRLRTNSHPRPSGSRLD